MIIDQLISGGQTGADQAALRAARALGIRTGGYAPKGWRTDDGPAPWLADYGLVEHFSAQYAPRTIANVRRADATLWFGERTSPGGRCTIAAVEDSDRLLCVGLLALQSLISADLIRGWLRELGISVLNVAGNRERTHPGIGARVEHVLLEALK